MKKDPLLAYSVDMTKYEEIVSRLEDMDQNDIKRLQSYLSCLTTLEDVQPDLFTKEVEIYQALYHVLHTYGVKAPTWVVFSKKKAVYQIFKTNCDTIDPFVEKLKACRKTDRQALYRLCFDMIHKSLRLQKRNVCLSSMVQAVTTIPDRFEDAFPGYVDDGMLPFLIANLRHHD